MLAIGASGFAASLCWFWAFGLALVAYVRAVGQLEAPISIAIAALVFHEGGLRRQLPALAAIVLGVVLVLVGCAEPARGAEDERALRARAERLHREAIVLDGHNDVTTWILDYGFDLAMDGSSPGRRDATAQWIPILRDLLPRPQVDEIRTDTDLARLRAGGVDAQFFSIFVDSRFVPDGPAEAGRARERAFDMIEAMSEQIRRHPAELELATTAADVRRLATAGRIAVLLGVEGGHAIESSLETLRELHARGARYMTLTWNNANDWADSCYEEPHGGLTDFGREVVREMNRLGMLVDVSHGSDATFWDVLEVTRAPVIASHSSARALAPIPRNLSDDMLRALARNGGVAMINFQDVFLDPRKTPPWRALGFLITRLGWPDTPFSLLVDHVEHVARVAGVDHVGLGSDFAGSFNMPEGMKSVADFPHVTLELLRRGWPEADVRKLLGENALRVLEEAERTARELAGEAPRTDQRGSRRIGTASSRPKSALM
jgi:membrane dipeptidase